MYTEKQGVKNGRQHLFNGLWCSTGMAEEGLDDHGGTTGLGDLRDPQGSSGSGNDAGMSPDTQTVVWSKGLCAEPATTECNYTGCRSRHGNLGGSPPFPRNGCCPQACANHRGCPGGLGQEQPHHMDQSQMHFPKSFPNCPSGIISVTICRPLASTGHPNFMLTNTSTHSL